MPVGSEYSGRAVGGRLASRAVVAGFAAFLGIVALAAGPAGAEWPSLSVLGAPVAPGEKRQLSLVASESFAGSSLPTPVWALRGRQPGPTLCLTAGIHGDELNGVEIVRRVIERLDPEALGGTVLAVPIVNLHGFRRSSRYLPDRRDLNRYFPGNPRGSSASRIAHSLFDGVIRHCNALVDLHTGSFYRTNLPQIRGDLRKSEVVDLALAFGAATVVHSTGVRGTLRRSAVEVGIPAVTFEAGEPMRFQRQEVQRGVQGVLNVMQWLGMREATPGLREPQRVYYNARWVRVDDGGILLARVSLGDRVAEGDVLGTVTDPISNERAVIRTPHAGQVIGMAVDQVVIPGFAAFHIGLHTSPSRGAVLTSDEESVWEAEGPEPLDGDVPIEMDERPE